VRVVADGDATNNLGGEGTACTVVDEVVPLMMRGICAILRIGAESLVLGRTWRDYY
jgi:hypothetical protein